MKEERRRFPRIKFPCKIKIASNSQETELILHTENISSGGLRFISQEKPEVNTPVDIELEIGDRRLVSKGRVVWVIEITVPGEERPNLFDVGIEFTQLTPEDKERLNRILNRFLEG